MHSDSNGPALLVLLAHPDDEFAIFPWLAQATAAARDVHVVFLTDGGYQGQDIERRRQESERVLEGLGVATDRQHFVGEALAIADGTLHLRLADALGALRTLAIAMDGVEIMVPAWEGGHQDHDASHLLGLALASGTSIAVWEFSLYNGRGLPGPFFRVLSPIPRGSRSESIRLDLRGRLACIGRCLQYRSQWKSFVGLLPFYAWKMRLGNAFSRQSTSRARTAQPPHAGALLYERRVGLRWTEFAEATREFRA